MVGEPLPLPAVGSPWSVGDLTDSFLLGISVLPMQSSPFSLKGFSVAGEGNANWELGKLRSLSHLSSVCGQL